jgi:hypothetical protein
LAYSPGVAPPSIAAVIAGNSVHLMGSLASGQFNAAGVGEYDAQNVSVLGNRFWGIGMPAI